jgi:hypothetical protein
MKLLAIRLSPQAGKSLVTCKGEGTGLALMNYPEFNPLFSHAGMVATEKAT